MKAFNIEAVAHKKLSSGYRVKVSILDIGLYINGMVVFPPNEEHEHWSVYPPSVRAGRGKYSYITEFNKKLPLWEEIFDACVDAVKLKQSESDDKSDDEEVVITDIPDDPISLEDIPF